MLELIPLGTRTLSKYEIRLENTISNVIEELEFAVTCMHSLSVIARVWLFVIFWLERALLLPEDLKELQRV